MRRTNRALRAFALNLMLLCAAVFPIVSSPTVAYAVSNVIIMIAPNATPQMGVQAASGNNYTSDNFGLIYPVATGDVSSLQQLGFIVLNARNNVTATRAPTISDDYTAGYNLGSIWLNNAITGVVLYICTNMGNTPGNATWVAYPAIGPGSISPIDIALTNGYFIVGNASNQGSSFAGGTGVATAMADAINTSGGFLTSAGLTNNALVIGAGSGSPPTTTTTGTGVLTALGIAVNTAGGMLTYTNETGFTPTLTCGTGTIGTISRNNNAYSTVNGQTRVRYDVQFALGTCSGSLLLSLPITISASPHQVLSGGDFTTGTPINCEMAGATTQCLIVSSTGSNPTGSDSFILNGILN